MIGSLASYFFILFCCRLSLKQKAISIRIYFCFLDLGQRCEFIFCVNDQFRNKLHSEGDSCLYFQCLYFLKLCWFLLLLHTQAFSFFLPACVLSYVTMLLNCNHRICITPMFKCMCDCSFQCKYDSYLTYVVIAHLLLSCCLFGSVWPIKLL
jgi:hypothetical protein